MRIHTRLNWLLNTCRRQRKLSVYEIGSTPTIPSSLTLFGQPSLASDGHGNVVYAMRASDKVGTINRIAAGISTDGGTSFENVVLVNDDQCTNGTQDMPYATFDTTTQPPTLWVVWRHKGGGVFGGCIRHGTLDLTTGPPDGCAGGHLPVIHWLDPGQDVDKMDHDFGIGGNSQGGLIVQAGDG
jgi:hypothetical protein